VTGGFIEPSAFQRFLTKCSRSSREGTFGTKFLRGGSERKVIRGKIVAVSSSIRQTIAEGAKSELMKYGSMWSVARELNVFNVHSFITFMKS